jgi:hypothetical protein
LPDLAEIKKRSMTVRFVKAGKFWSWLLPRLGGHAITMPWKSVYLLPHVFDNERTRFHETIHVEQIERDGSVTFSVSYLYYCCRYGYWKNPYEVEAYSREQEKYASAVTSTTS